MKDIHIIVVDDDISIRTMLGKLLGLREHYIVDVVADGAAAFELMPESPVDLVITDLFLGPESGFDVLERMHNDYPDTRLIAMSGSGCFDHNPNRQRALSAGADACIEKPFSLEGLFELIESLFHSTDERAESRLARAKACALVRV